MTSNTEEKAHRYRTKVKYIEAIKWTGSNLDNVKEFIKDRYVASIDDYGGLTVGPSDTAFSLYVPKGYYISKDKDGKLSVNVGLVFESEYERYKHGR